MNLRQQFQWGWISKPSGSARPSFWINKPSIYDNIFEKKYFCFVPQRTKKRILFASSRHCTFFLVEFNSFLFYYIYRIHILFFFLEFDGQSLTLHDFFFLEIKIRYLDGIRCRYLDGIRWDIYCRFFQ